MAYDLEAVSKVPIAAIDGYARELGLAFQIIDDILDATADTATLGAMFGAVTVEKA